jgi:hypothetical protein
MTGVVGPDEGMGYSGSAKARQSTTKHAIASESLRSGHQSDAFQYGTGSRHHSQSRRPGEGDEAIDAIDLSRSTSSTTLSADLCREVAA